MTIMRYVRTLSFLLVATTFLCSPRLFADGPLDIAPWMEEEFQAAQMRLVENISPWDGLRGTVIASPSRSNPNYYYHWIRDGALVMKTIFHLSAFGNQNSTANSYFDLVIDFANLSEIHQNSETPGSLGEVKFYVDGTPFTGPWGRPQNDGPALRAITLTALAHKLYYNGSHPDLLVKLYDSQMPTSSIIKRDLEYISEHWRDHDFDLWEEVKAHHFFTRLAQSTALKNGADLAILLDDPFAAQWYHRQATLIDLELEKHWAPSEGSFLAHLDRISGVSYKSGLDASVILALLLNDRKDSKLGIHDDRYQSTVLQLEERFSRIYRINQDTHQMAPAIGRYPEDLYDGTGSSRGNPWFLTTLGFAQYYYRLADALHLQKAIPLTPINRKFWRSLLSDRPELFSLLSSARALERAKDETSFLAVIDELIEKGDQFINRVKKHMDGERSMSEQFDRNNGFMRGARDLSWSYSALIEAALERCYLFRHLGRSCTNSPEPQSSMR